MLIFDCRGNGNYTLKKGWHDVYPVYTNPIKEIIGQEHQPPYEK